MGDGMHPTSAVDVRTVRKLIDEQRPQWRGMSVEKVQTAGTENAIFRLGADLAVRFPPMGQEGRGAV